MKDASGDKPDANLPEGPEKYFYYENGLIVFTEAYHLLRGYCCERGCRHCPYKSKKPGSEKT